MDDSRDGAYAREPQAEDLARLCQALNAAGARYVLIGGFAIIAHGVRPSDAADRRFLEALIRASEEA